MVLEEKLLNRTMEAGDEIGASNSVDHNHMKNSNVPTGGYTACLFVFAQNGLDSIGFVANVASIVLYFSNVMYFDNSGSANTFTNYLGTASLVSVVGGVISDSYMNRLNTTLLFGGFQLLGYILLIIQAHYKKLQPEDCKKYSCVHGTMALLFYASTTFAALGGGGIRGVVPALGADQFNKNDPKENKHIASYFNWFLFSSTVGACFGVTIVVWVSSNKGWDKAFTLSLLCSFTGLLILAVGKPLYRVRVPGESALIRVTQVLFVALRNRKVKLPQNSCDLYEIRESESGSVREQIRHTDQFRLLDKSAVLPEGVTPKNWTVCTVTQVEEVKVLTRMMPILLSTILLNTCLGQLQTFSVQQGNQMNSKFGKFNVPSPSIPIIPLAFMSILVPLYEIIFVPMVRKFTGHPNGITHLQRVGVGLVLCVISMGIAGVIEVKRKKEFLHNNHRINLFWLSYHFAIFGIADMFTFVGLMEFFYSEAPQGMRSLSTSFTYLSTALGYYLSSIFVEIINLVSSKLSSSKKGWLEGSDLNKNHLEYFYWFLAILSLLNFGNYVFWANWYKYKEDVPIDKHNSKN